MEEVESLVGLLYQGFGVGGPGEAGSDTGAQKREGGDRFFIYNEGGVDLSMHLGVCAEFFCFKDIQFLNSSGTNSLPPPCALCHLRMQPCGVRC